METKILDLSQFEGITLGDWKVENLDSGIFITQGPPTGTPIAKINPIGSVSTSQELANAKVMAKSPEILTYAKALEAIVQHFIDTMDEDHTTYGVAWVALRKVREDAKTVIAIKDHWKKQYSNASIFYTVTDRGYEVEVVACNEDGNTLIEEYSAGNHPNDSQQVLSPDHPIALDRSQLKELAKVTVGEMAKEYGIPIENIQEEFYEDDE